MSKYRENYEFPLI